MNGNRTNADKCGKIGTELQKLWKTHGSRICKSANPCYGARAKQTTEHSSNHSTTSRKPKIRGKLRNEASVLLLPQPTPLRLQSRAPRQKGQSMENLPRWPRPA